MPQTPAALDCPKINPCLTAHSHLAHRAIWHKTSHIEYVTISVHLHSTFNKRKYNEYFYVYNGATAKKSDILLIFVRQKQIVKALQNILPTLANITKGNIYG